MGKEDTDMTIEELEAYCVRESVKSEKKTKGTSSQAVRNYYHGCADTYRWVASVIQQNKPRETPH